MCAVIQLLLCLYFRVSFSFNFRIGRSTVCSILEETCEAIYAELKKDFVKAPSVEEWEGISREFYQTWKFPHCLGILKQTSYQVTMIIHVYFYSQQVLLTGSKHP